MTTLAPRGLLVRPPLSVHTASIHFGLIYLDLSSPFKCIHHFYIPSSLVAPSPHRSMITEWKDLWGDGSIRPFEEHLQS